MMPLIIDALIALMFLVFGIILKSKLLLGISAGTIVFIIYVFIRRDK